jgi:hypothetical protein
MAKPPAAKSRLMTPDEIRDALRSGMRQITKVIEARNGDAARNRQAQGRPAPMAPVQPSTQAGQRPSGAGQIVPSQDMFAAFRNSDATPSSMDRFRNFKWPAQAAGAAPPPAAPPPRRSAQVIRVEEGGSPPFMFGPGPGTLYQTSRPRIVYRPPAVGAQPYDKDMSDSDFTNMAKRAGFFESRRFDRAVIGIGAAQGRMIPLALARRLGGYIDPDTGKTMRFAGDYARANALLDQYGSKEMTRRHEAMVMASIERGLQSTGEQRLWAATRGAVDGALVDGAAPLGEAAIQVLDRGTRWSDAYAAAKYQTAQDEIEHPVMRNGAMLATAFLPTPGGKVKAATLGAKIGREVARDAITGGLGGYLTTEGDPAERLNGALKDAAANVVIGRTMDGLVGVGGRALDRVAPQAWRWATGFDLPSTDLVARAVEGDGATLNGLALQATDGSRFAPGPHMNDLAAAFEDVRAGRSGLTTLPAATPGAGAARSDVLGLDTYAFNRLGNALAGDQAVLDGMVRGRYFEAQRQALGEPVKALAGKAAELALDKLDKLDKSDGTAPRVVVELETGRFAGQSLYKTADGSYFVGP